MDSDVDSSHKIPDPSLKKLSSSARPFHALCVAAVTCTCVFLIAVVSGYAEAAPTATSSPTPRPRPLASAAARVSRQIRLTYAIVTDYTAFSQDSTSIVQVGIQRTGYALRALRVGGSGTLGVARWVASVEYKGIDQATGDPTFGIRDLYLKIPVWKLGTLLIGRAKQPFVYEQIVESNFRSQTESILNPFFSGRSTSLSLTNTAATKRMTWTAGTYNLNQNANQYIVRVTGLPEYNKSGANYVHLAVSDRYEGANNGVLRFNGRPESFVASNYVDTGSFTANFANELGAEFLANRGPFALTSEYVQAWVNAPQNDNPRFYGYYVMGSWIITGEHRPYDRDSGFARRIVPQRPSGAWELVARFDRVDLSSGAISGGVMNKMYLGANWWRSAQWALQVGYGSTGLERFQTYGHTKSLLTRVQFVY
jgi:phosphate-selective porin OprO and OprP